MLTVTVHILSQTQMAVGQNVEPQTDHFTCRSKCRCLIMKLLKKFRSNRDAILVIKFVAFGELTVIFLGCPFLKGPSRYAVCVS